MEKSPDAFRTIREVAEWLDTPAHVLRFWESRFSQVKPVKRAGGRRYYRPRDMRLLGGIKRLLHEDGMTIKGVQKMLQSDGIKAVSALSQQLESDLEGPFVEAVAEPPAPSPIQFAPKTAADKIAAAPPPSSAAAAETPDAPEPAQNDLPPMPEIMVPNPPPPPSDLSAPDSAQDTPPQAETSPAQDQPATHLDGQPAPVTQLSEPMPEPGLASDGPAPVGAETPAPQDAVASGPAPAEPEIVPLLPSTPVPDDPQDDDDIEVAQSIAALLMRAKPEMLESQGAALTPIYMRLKSLRTRLLADRAD